MTADTDTPPAYYPPSAPAPVSSLDNTTRAIPTSGILAPPAPSVSRASSTRSHIALLPKYTDTTSDPPPAFAAHPTPSSSIPDTHTHAPAPARPTHTRSANAPRRNRHARRRDELAERESARLTSLHPGGMTRDLKIRLGLMILVGVIGIPALVLPPALTGYAWFLFPPALPMIYVVFCFPLAGWQSVRGRFHRFWDRGDAERHVISFQCVLWLVNLGLALYFITGDTCTARLAQYVEPGPAACAGLAAWAALSAVQAVLMFGWRVWFGRAMGRWIKLGQGRRWDGSTSAVMREWT